ncbi:hypothetical protein HMPREF9443_01473 [Phascolarctobacterium succinatutens YIT 12067]|uniref:Uncharacterized protein n=1 Tax=Phascolarctobacterium succinatutens YIT 12067 TaxID=626939 RepID=E8LF38_9FIRM|nr:hypothetical protein HMPREF9443_01473 [Phascolarctobacterium succinatutens YIT 12067]
MVLSQPHTESPSFGKNLPKTFAIKNEQALALLLKSARFDI